MPNSSTLTELLGDQEVRSVRQALEASDTFTRQLAADEFDASVRTRQLFAQDRGLAERALGSPYYEGSQNSWLTDQLARHRGNAERTVLERLARYTEVGLELRASTTATFNGLVPPAYLTAETATASRPARQIADALGKIELPVYGNIVQLPRPASGATVDAQTAQNVNPTGIDPVFLADQVVTLAALEGMVDASRQSVERSDAGRWVIAEVQAAYNRRVGSQALFGTGAAGQVLGLANQPGLTSVAYTTGAPSTALLSSAIAGAAAGVAAATGCNYGDVVVGMHPRRYASIMRDTAGLGDDPAAQAVAGLRVVTDPNVRTVLGAGTNEDEIFVFDPLQVGLIESPYSAFRFDQVVGPATIRLACWAYAQVLTRIPGAVARISGTGLTAPTF
jgi:Phage capsid family